jgi:2-polyprenyl-3-methyl-5-hydroxy-6-metoxy-1,4-benzoquinol methylase
VSRYDTVVDLENRNKSQTLTALLVGEGKTVLDVGCATGYLAEALKARGCTVSGIEVDPEAAEIARPKLDRLVLADLETTPLAEAFAGSSFDRIVFADVLEHVRDPATVLRSALGVLGADGEIIISIPNVAHGALRLALLEGRWRYTELGLLDRTHLRFFTLESLVQLLSEVGLVIREAWSTTADVLATEVEVAPDGLPDEIVEWVRYQPRALDYQFVLRAARGRPTNDLPEVRQAIAAEDIRPDDDHARRSRELARQRHRVLTLQDEVIGLTATLRHIERRSATGAAHDGGQGEQEELLARLQREREELLERVRTEQEDLRRSLHAEQETSSRLQRELAELTAGLEREQATTRRLGAGRAELQTRLDGMEVSARQQASELRKVTRDRDRILRSRAFRLGRALTAPMRAARRRLP